MLFPCERHERISEWQAPEGRCAAPMDGLRGDAQSVSRFDLPQQLDSDNRTIFTKEN